MNKNEFLKELEDVLQREEPCNENDILENYDEWDSLSKMAIMAYYDKTFGIKINLNQIENVEKVSDLIAIVGDKISD